MVPSLEETLRMFLIVLPVPHNIDTRVEQKERRETKGKDRW